MQAVGEKRWFQRHVKTVAAVCANLVILGMGYATMRDDIRVSQEKIRDLEAQKADEIRWRVGEHEKRLDGHDATFLRQGEKLDRISATVERIDQRTERMRPGVTTE